MNCIVSTCNFQRGPGENLLDRLHDVVTNVHTNNDDMDAANVSLHLRNRFNALYYRNQGEHDAALHPAVQAIHIHLGVHVLKHVHVHLYRC